MDILSVIRRWQLREDRSIREIVRRTGLSRHTIRKYPASGVIEPRYPDRKSPGQPDPFADSLLGWLKRASKRHRQQRRSVRQLHLDLVELGYPGSYDRFAAFARDWRSRQQQATLSQATLSQATWSAAKGTLVVLVFAPGEAFQFDWSEGWAVIGGERSKLQVAHFKLCHSRAFMLRACPLQTHEMLFAAHNHALIALGGVAERGIYDTMKTVVDKVRRGKRRDVNKHFKAMLSHFLLAAEFCNPAADWEKGQLEKHVRDSRYRIWHNAPACKTLSDLSCWLEQRCKELWCGQCAGAVARRTVTRTAQATASTRAGQ